MCTACNGRGKILEIDPESKKEVWVDCDACDGEGEIEVDDKED